MNVNQVLDTLLQRNPEMQNNPMAKQMIDVIRSGDSAKGQQIANNLCKSNGVSPQDAIKQAQQFFGLK